MGGTGSGGGRVGSGRKPHRKKPAVRDVTPPGVLKAIAGRAALAAVPKPTPAAPPKNPLESPPRGMGREEQAIWKREAPRAVRRGTLIEETLTGFAELVDALAMKADIKRKMKRNKGGVAGVKSEGLLRQYVRIGQRVDVLLARFKLTSFGKTDDDAPEPPSGPAPKPNPWSAVG